MTRVDRASAYVVGPATPHVEWIRIGSDGTGLAPQRKHRTFDPHVSAIGLVVLVVQRRGGAVLLADRMDGRGVAELADVYVAQAGRDRVRIVGPLVQHVIDDRGR